MPTECPYHMVNPKKSFCRDKCGGCKNAEEARLNGHTWVGKKEIRAAKARVRSSRKTTTIKH